MTTDQDTDLDELHDQIAELLAEADERIDSLEEDDTSSLEGLASDAAELVSETHPRALINAITAEDDASDSVETIPAAIAKSDRMTVVTLRKLLALAKMDSGDGLERSGQIETYRELLGLAEESSVSSDQPETERGDEPLEPVEQLRTTIQDGIDEFRERLDALREEDADESGDQETDEDRWRGQGTMLSTMPSSNRADMTVVSRFSTVRKK